MNANTNHGIELCQELYKALSKSGFFPALTGGLLYKDGERKDIDIAIYRHRQQVAAFEMEEIEHLLSDAGVCDFSYHGFVTKCKWKGFSVDLFNPESKMLSEEEYKALPI